MYYDIFYFVNTGFFLLKYIFKHCRDRGGYLAEILSKKEENALFNGLFENATYWIGLSDRKNEGRIYQHKMIY